MEEILRWWQTTNLFSPFSDQRNEYQFALQIVCTLGYDTTRIRFWTQVWKNLWHRSGRWIISAHRRKTFSQRRNAHFKRDIRKWGTWRIVTFLKTCSHVCRRGSKSNYQEWGLNELYQICPYEVAAVYSWSRQSYLAVVDICLIHPNRVVIPWILKNKALNNFIPHFQE